MWTAKPRIWTEVSEIIFSDDNLYIIRVYIFSIN